jgi:HD superfamily phosphodiesterase
MSNPLVDLHKLLEIEFDDEVRNEVRHTHGLSFPGSSLALFERCFDDTIRLFTGQYEGYQACKTEYHDLRHTMEVLLATVRMIHAAILAGKVIQAHSAELALLAALMHDIGYIQREGESGRGGQHTLVHVERSAGFFDHYADTLGLTAADKQRCCCMITATSLAVDPNTISYQDEETELMAKLVASADLLGQLADRIYLEKLLFLYQEFREAGVMAYANELDLLTQTCAFYTMVRQRLDHKLGGLDRSLLLHFRERWQIDRDLYAESIALNLQYLDKLVGEYRQEYRNMLKRGGIVERILKAEAFAGES